MPRHCTILVGFAVVLMVTTAIAAPSAEECKKLRDKADADKDAFVAGSEATEYLAAIAKSGKEYDQDKDGKLSQSEFMSACQDGIFDAIKKEN
jgi:hypothetical protein